MEYLKRNVIWIGGVAAVAVFFVAIYEQPCTEPITYRIGRIDPGFGLSRDRLLSSIHEAVDIWSTPMDKSLFAYEEDGKLTINLIYDERQKITQQNAELKADVEKTNQLATSLKVEYEALLGNLEVSKRAYNEELERFNKQQEQYVTQVDYWNDRGGAPPAEYNALQAERLALEEEREDLERKRLAMNNLVADINAFIRKYNLLVEEANDTISTINQHAGKEFQEGSYDPVTDTINIYEYSSYNKLTRVLAHEFGHALDLPHNSNPASIMYELNQSNTLTLSKDDIAALKEHCGTD